MFFNYKAQIRDLNITVIKLPNSFPTICDFFFSFLTPVCIFNTLTSSYKKVGRLWINGNSFFFQWVLQKFVWPRGQLLLFFLHGGFGRDRKKLVSVLGGRLFEKWSHDVYNYVPKYDSRKVIGGKSLNNWNHMTRDWKLDTIFNHVQSDWNRGTDIIMWSIQILLNDESITLSV